MRKIYCFYIELTPKINCSIASIDIYSLTFFLPEIVKHGYSFNEGWSGPHVLLFFVDNFLKTQTARTSATGFSVMQKAYFIDHFFNQ